MVTAPVASRLALAKLRSMRMTIDVIETRVKASDGNRQLLVDEQMSGSRKQSRSQAASVSFHPWCDCCYSVSNDNSVTCFAIVIACIVVIVGFLTMVVTGKASGIAESEQPAPRRC